MLTKEPHDNPKEGERTKANSKEEKNTKITEFCKKKKRYNTLSGGFTDHEMNQNLKGQKFRNITSSLPHIKEHPVENSNDDSSSISVSTRNSISFNNYTNEEIMSCDDDSNYFVDNKNNRSMVTSIRCVYINLILDNFKQIPSRSCVYNTNILNSSQIDRNKISNSIRSEFLYQSECKI